MKFLIEYTDGWMNNSLYGHTLIGWISKSVFWGMCLYGTYFLQWLGLAIFPCDVDASIEAWA